MSEFIFKSYDFDVSQKSASFYYGLGDGTEFKETYTFNFDFVDYDATALDRALNTLFLVAGVSYYKTTLADEIIIEIGKTNEASAEFLENTYQNGLGEFFYVNKLDPHKNIAFPVNSSALDKIDVQTKGLLIGIGGGKDSILTTELLRDGNNIATWSLGHRKQLEPLVHKLGTKHFWVERSIDPKLLDPAISSTFYNGHVPVSAIFAGVGTVVAVLSGYRDTIVSNEQSANESTLVYEGVEINHQYSKTSAFEQSYQKLLASNFGDHVRYYSLLRPLHEIAITRQFARDYFDKYLGVFSSCNRAFRQSSEAIYWCSDCPKCAAIYLLMAPFISEEKLLQIFSSNLLLEARMEQTYRDLLGISGEKPLECVGEIAENRWAMSKLKKQYPELEKYTYEQATDAQVWNVSAHNIPEDIIERFHLEETFKKLAAK